MDLLITVLGNAVVQADFRDRLLRNGDPVRAAEEWGFRLTKGENEMLTQIFTGSPAYIEELKERFEKLEYQVYINTGCAKPCKMTVAPPVCPPSPAKAA